MSAAADPWTVALDRMDAQLDAITASLASGDLSRLPDLAIPRGLPALPPISVDRARELLARHRVLETQVRRRLETSAPPAAPRRPVSHSLAPTARAARFEAVG